MSALGGIGLLLNEKISWREYGRVGAILVCLFVTVCCIEWLSHVLGRIIRGERSIPRGAKRAIWAAVLYRRRLLGGHRSAGSGAHE